MVRTVLTVAEIIRDGLLVASVAGDAANGHSFNNSGENIFLHVLKGATGSVVITILSPIVIDGENVPDKVVTVVTDTEQFIGPFPKALYEQEDVDSEVVRSVLVDIDDDTNVTIQAVRLPDASY